MTSNKEKVLYIPLKKEFYNRIVTGEKDWESREYKEFWIKRLVNSDGSFKHYDFILFQCGYHTDAPQMLVEFKGVKINKNKIGFLKWEKEFEIALGKVKVIR